MSSLLRRLPAAGGLGDRGDSTQPHSPWLDVPDGDPTHPACKSRALERKWKAMAEWSEGTGQEPNGGRSALSRTYLLNKSGTHTLASLLIFGGLGLGGACLNRTIRPGDPTGWNAGLPWLVALIAVTSAAGGALGGAGGNCGRYSKRLAARRRNLAAGPTTPFHLTGGVQILI